MGWRRQFTQAPKPTPALKCSSIYWRISISAASKKMRPAAKYLKGKTKDDEGNTRVEYLASATIFRPITLLHMAGLMLVIGWLHSELYRLFHALLSNA